MYRKIISILAAISLSCLIIFFQVRVVFCTKSIYYNDINTLNIPNEANTTSYCVKHDYNAIIDYLLSPNSSTLKLDYFTMSQNAKIHFKDVKNILIIDRNLIITSLIIFLSLLFLCYKNRIYSFLKYSCWMLFSVCFIFIAFFCVNFEKAFILMHELLFSNKYWLFDIKADSVINILPQKYFFHCGICIIFLILFSGILLRGVYSIINK